MIYYCERGPRLVTSGDVVRLQFGSGKDVVEVAIPRHALRDLLLSVRETVNASFEQKCEVISFKDGSREKVSARIM